MTEHQEDDFLPFLQSRVEVSDLDATLFLREAVIAFMRDSKLFKGTLQITGQKGIKEYIMDIPYDQVIVDLITDGVTRNGMAFCDYYRDDHEEVLVIPGAQENDCYVVEFYYHIPRDGCGIPSVIYNKYLEPIISKAITLIYEGRNDTAVTGNMYNIHNQAYKEYIEEITARRMHKMGSGYAKMRLPNRSRKFTCR